VRFFWNCYKDFWRACLQAGMTRHFISRAGLALYKKMDVSLWMINIYYGISMIIAHIVGVLMMNLIMTLWLKMMEVTMML
jgi:hypothetical protein